jgi:hypothetical protein
MAPPPRESEMNADTIRKGIAILAIAINLAAIAATY